MMVKMTKQHTTHKSRLQFHSKHIPFRQHNSHLGNANSKSPSLIITILCISLSNIGSVLSSDVSSRQTDYWTPLLGGKRKTPRIKKCPKFTSILDPWKSVIWREKDKKLTPIGFLWKVKKRGGVLFHSFQASCFIGSENCSE